MKPKAMQRIYLDYAATTPVDPRVLRAIEPYFGVKFGNPGSLHSFGQEAIAAVDHARETIAQSIGADFRDIIFTGSATEANNLALRGTVALAARDKNSSEPPRIIISAIEHESILETARQLEREGAEVVIAPVDREGIVDIKKIKAALNEHTVLVSIMYANNEIGTIQPIAEIANTIKEFRGKRTDAQKLYPLFHTDAAQAFQFLNCDINALGVDLMTISSHKIYGPKGAAALYIRGAENKKGAKQARMRPIIFGGGQEFGLRSGTENVPAIVGFAKAIELADDMREKESERIAALRDRLWRGIKKIIPEAERNGGGNGKAGANSPLPRVSLPNILNVYFPGCAAQDLLTRFDLAGIAVSSGSACRSRAFEPSYVIEALIGNTGQSKERAKSSIRFSLGRLTTAREIDATIAALNSFRII